MPRCLMAKKWKAYPWPDRIEEPTIDNNITSNEEEEEIDVVGDSSTINNHNNSNNNNNNNNNNNSTSSNNNNNETNSNLVTKTTTIISSSCWGPSSPTAGATAPSPPPHSPEATRGSTILYNGYGGHDVSPMHFTAYLPRSENEVSVLTSSPYTSTNLQQQSSEIYSPRSPRSEQCHQSNISSGVSHLKVENIVQQQRKSLAMCFTSTGATLSLPPKKKDIYRPYSLDDRNQNQISSQQSPQQSASPTRNYEIRIPAEEDLHAAHAILDLSASTAFLPQPPQIIAQHPQCHTPTHQVHQVLAQQFPLHQHDLTINCEAIISENNTTTNNYKERKILISPTSRKIISSVQNENDNITNINSHETITSTIETGTKLVNGKTVAYTYEAFFVSDGRSKKKISDILSDSKSKYTCSECGKQYATSSNLSRHKQTHRSLDSQAAKKCMTCGKAYVSMPALAMHVLTHKLAHSCGVCGKLFSRPWLLQGHLRSHTGEKPYGCAHCGKAFADRSNLRAHMQTHSADKNFECQRCHKTFALKSYLNKHLESACFKEEGSITTTQNGGHVIIVNGNYSNENLVQPPSPSPNSSSQPQHTYQGSNTGLLANSIEMHNNFSG